MKNINFNWLFIQNQIFILIGGIVGIFIEKENNEEITCLIALIIEIINFTYCLIIENKTKKD